MIYNYQWKNSKHRNAVGNQFYSLLSPGRSYDYDKCFDCKISNAKMTGIKLDRSRDGLELGVKFLLSWGVVNEGQRT